jgi:hypothetical protein
MSMDSVRVVLDSLSQSQSVMLATNGIFFACRGSFRHRCLRDLARAETEARR